MPGTQAHIQAVILVRTLVAQCNNKQLPPPPLEFTQAYTQCNNKQLPPLPEFTQAYTQEDTQAHTLVPRYNKLLPPALIQAHRWEER